MNEFNLKNKRVIITGAAGLLGQQHAIALAAHGATLDLVDIDLQNLNCVQKSLPANTRSAIYQVDITDEHQVADFCEGLRRESLEEQQLVLINNAAIDAKVDSTGSKNLSRLENFDFNQWQKEISVGLTGAMLCCKHIGSLMAQRGTGNIINIASDLGVIAPNQGLYEDHSLPSDQQPVKPVTYSVIKHGLIGLTKYVATYWPTIVRCNALAPGGVKVQQPAQFIQKINQLIPMGRMANIDEYHGAIQFLASDASRYMNGQVMVLDGGRCVW
ncbi:SDR family oxidoreductase [Paraglaciecola sp.]|uniref:SDR family oxidoreductase n=1 Tax=Paraglaciecola sp. TaxID=1920173 RepID=UPI003265584C